MHTAIEFYLFHLVFLSFFISLSSKLLNLALSLSRSFSLCVTRRYFSVMEIACAYEVPLFTGNIMNTFLMNILFIMLFIFIWNHKYIRLCLFHKSMYPFHYCLPHNNNKNVIEKLSWIQLLTPFLRRVLLRIRTPVTRIQYNMNRLQFDNI